MALKSRKDEFVMVETDPAHVSSEEFRVSILFKQRWQGRCAQPCVNANFCSCYKWAEEIVYDR